MLDAACQGAVSREEATKFADRWLPAWSGNRPDVLINFYAQDAFYADPAVCPGIRGRDALRSYFGEFLGRYPDWQWHQIDAVPLAGGFLSYWRATIPLADRIVTTMGVSTVILDRGLITRNEVFFDRTPMFLGRAQPHA